MSWINPCRWNRTWLLSVADIRCEAISFTLATFNTALVGHEQTTNFVVYPVCCYESHLVYVVQFRLIDASDVSEILRKGPTPYSKIQVSKLTYVCTLNWLLNMNWSVFQLIIFQSFQRDIGASSIIIRLEAASAEYRIHFDVLDFRPP